MRRRDFLQITAAALLAAGVGPARRRLHAQAARRTADAGKLTVDIYSRHLQWLRTADEVADAASEMGFEGVNVTVRPYPGHVDPDDVAKQLPPFVNAIRARGLLVRSI